MIQSIGTAGAAWAAELDAREAGAFARIRHATRQPGMAVSAIFSMKLHLDLRSVGCLHAAYRCVIDA